MAAPGASPTPCSICSGPTTSTDTICPSCRSRSVRLTCRYCKIETRGAPNQASPEYVCQACATDMKMGPGPCPCKVCGLLAAFAGADTCRRCQHYRQTTGPPSICKACGRLAAFPRTQRQLARTRNQLLCFLCTREFKRRVHRHRLHHHHHHHNERDHHHHKERGASLPVGVACREAAAPTVSSSSPVDKASSSAEGAVIRPRSSTVGAASIPEATPSRAQLTLPTLLPIILTPTTLALLDFADVVLILARVSHDFRRALLPPTSNVLSRTSFTSLCLHRDDTPDPVVVRRLLALLGDATAGRIQRMALIDQPEIALEVLWRFVGLVHLDLTGCRFSDGAFAGLDLPSLVTLRVGSASKLSSSMIGPLPNSPNLILLDTARSRFAGALVHAAPAANRLALVDVSCTDLAAEDLDRLSPIHLRYLDVGGRGLSSRLTMSIARRFQALQFLSVRGAGASFGPFHMTRTLTICIELRHLDVSDTLIDDTAFAPHRLLSSLYMHNCRHLPKRPYLSALLADFPALSTLDVSSCIDLDDNSIASLAELPSRSLSVLNVGSLVKLSLKSISVLAKQIPSLHEIRIGGAWFLLDTDRIDKRIRQLNSALRLVRHDTELDGQGVQRFQCFLPAGINIDR